jgi:uncharacterized protein (DUF488 family)
MPAPDLLTIGHSNHPIERFVALLAQHAVSVLADVRSVPYSRRNPAYNREALERSLSQGGMTYMFLGKELGAKSPDPAHYEDGRVQYRRLAATELFKAGLARVIEQAKSHRLAIMCAEKDPLACHRTLLVARELEANDANVVHVHADGHLEPHRALLQRLRAQLGLPEFDLLRTQAELDAEAYMLQERRIAYVKKPALARPGHARERPDGMVGP